MCRGRGTRKRAAAVALVAVLAAAGGADAQELLDRVQRSAAAVQVPAGAPDGESPRAELERRLLEDIADLSEPFRAARERSMRARAVVERRAEAEAARRFTLDTLTAGPLRLIARPAEADEAREFFTSAWAGLAPTVEGGLDLSDVRFVYDPDGDLDRSFRDRTHRINGRSWREVSRERALESSFHGAVWLEVGRQLPPGIRRWTENRAPSPSGPDALADLYRQLVLTPSVAAEGCVEGRTDACWAALGLGTAPDPTSLWYSPEQLGSVPPAGRLREWIHCRAEGEGAICPDFTGDARLWMSAVPASERLRADFVGFALETGGAGSLRRLMDRTAHLGAPEQLPPQPEFARIVREGLAAAAGLDEDELVTRWRERLVSHRPESRGTGPTRTATFFWVLFFTAFATRSTRWRLG